MKNIYVEEKLLLRLTFNPGLALTGFRTIRPRGPFLEGPEKFSHPENRSEISNLIRENTIKQTKHA